MDPSQDSPQPQGEHSSRSLFERQHRPAAETGLRNRLFHIIFDHEGRLERDFDDDDRRRSVLRLSPDGLAVYDQIVPLALGFENLILADMSDTERDLLFRLLDRLDELELRAEGASL